MALRDGQVQGVTASQFAAGCGAPFSGLQKILFDHVQATRHVHQLGKCGTRRARLRVGGVGQIGGELAGSGLTMDAAVRNAVKMLKVNLPQAVRMASANPAGVLKLDQRQGSIQPGYDADMVLLDKSLQVQRSWVQGRCVYCHS